MYVIVLHGLALFVQVLPPASLPVDGFTYRDVAAYAARGCVQDDEGQDHDSYERDRAKFMKHFLLRCAYESRK